MTISAIFPRSTPEEQGVPSTVINGFLDAAVEAELELHSLMFVRNGHVIAEGWWSPFNPVRVHLLYSLSKSFTSSAVGIAVEEGLLSVNDPLISFFPDEAPDVVGEYLAEMRVHHLLSMATGHQEDTLERIFTHNPRNWIKGFLAIPPDQAPGTLFTYNNGATFMLAAILHKLTGMKLIDYLRPRLLDPLGIVQARWSENPQGINLGFSGLHITTESIAALGQLYLQKGLWQGQQLISEDWVAAATSEQIANSANREMESVDWIQGYGYQFWLCRHNAYRADGAFGQFCVVLPEQNVVVAITAGVVDMQSVLDLLWRHLLPAIGMTALDEATVARRALASRLSALRISPLVGETSPAPAESVYGRRYQFETEGQEVTGFEESLLVSASLAWGTDHFLLILQDDEQDHRIACGHGAWLAGETGFGSREARKIMASGAWTGTHTFTAKICFVETPHTLTVDLQFEGDLLHLGRRWNVSFGPLELPSLIGRMQ